MASPSNQHQQPNRVSSPLPLIGERDLPPHPSQPPLSDSESTSQNQTTADPTSSIPTNPTPLTSIPQDKSIPNSLYDTTSHPDGRLRIPSGSANEHLSRYPSRPRPVFAFDDTSHQSARLQSGLEWIPEKRRENTVAVRLEYTKAIAEKERDKYAKRASQYSYAINGAIGLQVAAGALTTGVAAATTGRSTSIGVSILGGLSTMLASFLAKSRGSGEPEFSTLRARELDTFVRELDAWIMDHGNAVGSEYDERINKFRARFEEIIKTEGEDSNSGIGFGGAHKSNGSATQSQQWQGNPRASEKV